MAFMIPVLRRDMNVYAYAYPNRNNSSNKSCSRGQVSDCPGQLSGSSLPTSPRSGSAAIGISSRKRNLAIEIRNQQHRRSAGSLPNSFNSGHLSLPVSHSSPSENRRPRSNVSRLNSRNVRSSAPVSPAKTDVSLPSSEGTTPPKVGSQSSLQKFHCRLLDRLRRSFRMQPDENVTNDQGSRASS